MAGFKKAVRENIWTKTLFISPSGGGKSLSALRMATGFAKELSKKTGKEERIAYINTEPNRGTLYAPDINGRAKSQFAFDYDILELEADYTPEKYVAAIDEAIHEGYKILIIDSITHEWSGKGGCLQIHSKIPGNTYTAWGQVTPRHEAFMEKILDSPIHIFATVRGEDKYDVQEVNGKKVPVKLAIGYDQRKQTEYLFITTFSIDLESHRAITFKDNTTLFSSEARIISEKDGEMLFHWAVSGNLDKKHQEIIQEQQKIKDQLKAEEEEEAKIINELKKTEIKEIEGKSLEEIKVEILEIAKKKAKNNREEVKNAIKGEGLHTSENPNTIKDLEIARKVYKNLMNI